MTHRFEPKDKSFTVIYLVEQFVKGCYVSILADYGGSLVTLQHRQQSHRTEIELLRDWVETNDTDYLHSTTHNGTQTYVKKYSISYLKREKHLHVA
jgi:hypothetical protein